MQGLRVGFAAATLAEAVAIALVFWWFLGGVASMRPKGLSDIANVYYSHNSPLLLAPVVIFVFAWNSGAISRILSLRPLVLLGQISFSTYMLHQIVIRFAATNDWHSALGTPAAAGLAVAISYAGSWLIWRFVEEHFRRVIVHRLARVPLPLSAHTVNGQSGPPDQRLLSARGMD
ncbi:MAG: acyltransferase [Mesorhizobium sp.]|nr:acyltransferase [Mesorhizobium sp.]